MEDLNASEKSEQALLTVFTGNGKGKTTAALGMVLRALGHGLKVCVIQFIKGSWTSGEHMSLKRFNDLLDIYVKGKGFTWKSKDIQQDINAAREAWDFAKLVMSSGKYKMVVLDELTYLIKYNMVNEDEIINFLINRPEGLHVVVTGRYATDRLIEVADTVTNMVSVKHHYERGIRAQRGIEY